MKIGINARFLTKPYTGIGKYTTHLLKALAKCDFKNEYLLFTPELVDLKLPGNFKQVRVPESDSRSASIRKFNWENKRLPAEFEKWKVDLVHFLYPSNPKKKLPVPVIVTVHDAIPWKLKVYRQRLRSKFYHFYAKLALKKADHLITVSQFSMNEVRSAVQLKEKPFSVIPLAAPLLETDNIPQKVNLRRKFLLYVGGYDLRKNVPLLLVAYQKFIANQYPIDLILVNGNDRGLEHFITDRFKEKVAGCYPVKAKGKIIFTGSLPDEELATLYKKAMALVHPSIYEGFNLPLVEAMENDLPMLVSDIPVNREVAQNAAFYADPKDEDTFGLALHEFLNNPTLCRDLVEHAKIRRKDFSWAQTAKKTLEIYESFYKGKK